MFAKSTNQISAINLLSKTALVLFVLCFGLINSGNAQNAQTGVSQVKASQPKTKAAQTTVWNNYKNVQIGMTAEEVKKTLGGAKSEDKDGFFYTISETETVQILLDSGQKVRVILAIFDGSHPSQPKFEDVFGSEMRAEPKPDGSVYKLVKYPNAGYWIAYNRTAGDKPMVTITIQKM